MLSPHGKKRQKGVPQGSILGPTLLHIFMNDLVHAIKHCSIVNYADDVQNNLNIDLENATLWFIQNSMKHNPDKYQAMVLGKTEDRLNFKLAEIDIKSGCQRKPGKMLKTSTEGGQQNKFILTS